MASVVFDSIKKFTSVGLTEEQAVAQTQAIAQMVDEHLTELEIRFEAKFGELKTEIIKHILPLATYDEARQVFDIDIPSGGINLDRIINNLEKILLLKALERSESHQEAARLLKISYQSLRHRLKKHGIEKRYSP